MNTLNKKKIICAILLAMILTWPVCRGIHHIKRFKIVKTYRVKHEALVDKYLTNKNGIEIGGSAINDFHLYDKGGSYCNVNWAIDAWAATHRYTKYVVNIVANGDDLPFKDNTFDYVFTSHVMEHFFDPIKAIQEHLRVIKKGGVLVYIIPHVDVIYDKGRDITDWKELQARHNGKIKVSDYYEIKRNKWKDKNDTGMISYSVLKSKIDGDTNDYFVNNIGEKIAKNTLQTFKEDNHHHWNVWRPKDFLEMAKYSGFNVIEWKEKDDNIGNGFVVVIQK